MTIKETLQNELALRANQVNNVLALLDDKATIPFIARYRKEATGGLDEIILRDFQDRYEYLKELEERKETILKTIDDQGRLTEDLKRKIDQCTEKSKLEDLYLPYKPKRKTRASEAKEKGLEPLLIKILFQNDPLADLNELAKPFVDQEKGVATMEDALKGAADIFAEVISERAENRELVRTAFLNKGQFVSKVRKSYKDKKTKFSMYYDYNVPVKAISSHNMLALRRGESEDVIFFIIGADNEQILERIYLNEIKITGGPVRQFLQEAIEDGYERLLKSSITAEIRSQKKVEADFEAIRNFGKNLRQLLLLPPAGNFPILAVDPGFRTGCKVASLDEAGRFIEFKTIFPHSGSVNSKKSEETILQLIAAHCPRYIAVGNGTASRETETFLRKTIKQIDKEKQPEIIIVSESGASIYSASTVAQKEFPDLDLTIRGAISIGRRLIDPLAELVKIDPKSIGVGQYQHDVDQKLLKKKLGEVVESCVNHVGVDLNSASAELLSYVSGINSKVADKIISKRDDNGHFANRSELMAVEGLGAKAFQQAAGFLRIKEGDNPLDNSAVHPESYYIVKKIGANLNVPIENIIGHAEVIAEIDPNDFTDEKTGIATIKDIIEELKKPGRDPRSTFKYAGFREDILEIGDIEIGMRLEGIVTNVTNFGAFVDLGVHQDGLVHISQLANKFVKDPTEIVSVGDFVSVKVLDVDMELKRISLSMKAANVS